MKKLNLPALITGVFLATAGNSSLEPANDNTQKVISSEDLAKRGKYLVNVFGCNDCHSPKLMTRTGTG